MNVRSKRPYLLRALFEWIVDSELTPYVLIAAGDDRVVVPRQYVEDGKIVLNVSPSAVRNLMFDEHYIRFDGRFGGTPFAVEAPITQVLAIYAKETGDGMMFDAEEPGATATTAEKTDDERGPDAGENARKRSAKPKDGPGPHLTVIK